VEAAARVENAIIKRIRIQQVLTQRPRILFDARPVGQNRVGAIDAAGVPIA